MKKRQPVRAHAGRAYDQRECVQPLRLSEDDGNVANAEDLFNQRISKLLQ